ncbi:MULTISPECIES: MFS transporter [unclassified Streptomyces]|uniref:MFS transporter n=1 Tax=unclassified Streptomyces TaxID=2593676 RepID=UPI003321B53B
MAGQARTLAAPGTQEEMHWRETRRGRLGWYGYDCATSVFATSVTSIFFGPYITDVSENAADVDGYVHPLGIPVLAGSFYPYVAALSVLLQAFLLPAAAALSERHDRGRLLAVFAAGGSCAGIGMVAIGPTDYLLGGVLYVVSIMALGASIMIANTYIPILASPRRQDRMSTEGSAAGFLACGLVLVFDLALYANHETVGLTESQAVRLILLITGVWWLVFAIVAIWMMRGYGTPPAVEAQSVTSGVYRTLFMAVRRLWKLPGARWFLIAFLLYNNGMQAVTSLVGTYAVEEIGISQDSLVIAILAVQFVAFAGALIAGRLAERYGGRRVLQGLLVAWMLTVVTGALVPDEAFFAFLSLCVGAGLVVGGTYALSRSVFIRLVPEDQTTEFIGIFEMVNRCLAFLGTSAFGIVLQVSGSYRLAWLSILAFFAIGGVTLVLGVRSRGASGSLKERKTAHG